MAIIYPASGRDQLYPALGGRICDEYSAFCKTTRIPKTVAIKNIRFHKYSLHSGSADAKLKFQKGWMKDYLLDNPSLPAIFIRQNLFDRMLEVNTARFVTSIDKFSPW